MASLKTGYIHSTDMYVCIYMCMSVYTCIYIYVSAHICIEMLMLFTFLKSLQLVLT